MNKKLIGSIARILISFTLIALLLFIMRKQLGDVLGLLLNIKIPLLVVAMLLLFLSHFVIAIRLRLFLAAQEIILAMKEVFGLTLIGYFFNNFLPTAVGGDVVKAYYASKKTDGKLHTFTAVFIDRFVGSLALIFIALVAFVLLSTEIKGNFIIWPMWVLFLGAIIFLSIIFNKKVMSRISSLKVFGWVDKLHSSFLAFKGRKWLFSKAFGISLVAQFFSFSGVWFFIKALSGFVPFIKVALIMPMIYIASMFPSVNGLGVREGAFLVFFRPLIGAEKAFALSLLWLFSYILVGIFGGFVYAFAKHGKREKIR